MDTYQLLTTLRTLETDNLGRSQERFYRVGTLCRVLDSDGRMATVELPDGEVWKVSTYFLRRDQDDSVYSG